MHSCLAVFTNKHNVVASWFINFLLIQTSLREFLKGGGRGPLIGSRVGFVLEFYKGYKRVSTESPCGLKMRYESGELKGV